MNVGDDSSFEARAPWSAAVTGSCASDTGFAGGSGALVGNGAGGGAGKGLGAGAGVSLTETALRFRQDPAAWQRGNQALGEGGTEPTEARRGECNGEGRGSGHRLAV